MTMDIIHDYEYYEAHAKDVKLEDIASSQKNADLLARLRDNDPELTYISIVTELEDENDFLVREGDHLGWLGYFVGRNDKLKTLYIDSFPENFNLNAFLEGLGHNQSIQDLNIGIDLGESFQKLVPFLRNNDRLRDIYFGGFDVGLHCARNIALLLDQQSSFKRLDFEDIGFDDEEFSQIIIALRSQPQLEVLGLSGHNVGRGGFVALGGTLESCSSLKKLYLTNYDHDDDNIGDEGLNALVAGLKHCHNLTSLSLNGIQMITEEGSRSLSALFQSDNCRLEHLHLEEINIGDDGMAFLATGLASLPSLKRLILRDNFIGDRGLKDLTRALVNCNLEKLDLSRNILMDSVSGMRSLGTLVRRSTNMNNLFLCDCSLTDEGIQSFVEGMANCCSLREFDLVQKMF